MSVYRQTCACRGRSLSAVKDIARYEQAVHDIGLDMIRLKRDQDEARQSAKQARIRLLDQPVGVCSVCSGSGVVESRGEVGKGAQSGIRISDWIKADTVG